MLQLNKYMRSLIRKLWLKHNGAQIFAVLLSLTALLFSHEHKAAGKKHVQQIWLHFIHLFYYSYFLRAVFLLFNNIGFINGPGVNFYNEAY